MTLSWASGNENSKASRVFFFAVDDTQIIEDRRIAWSHGISVCTQYPSWNAHTLRSVLHSQNVNTSLMPSSLLHPPPFTTSASSPHLPSEVARRKRNSFGSGSNNGSPGDSGGGPGAGGLLDSDNDVDSISSSSSTTSLPSWASGEAGGGMLHPSSFAPPFYNRPPTVRSPNLPSSPPH